MSILASTRRPRKGSAAPGEPPGSIAVQIDQAARQLPLADLYDPPSRDRWVTDCEGQAVEIVLDGLLDLSCGDRLALLSLLAQIASASYRVGDDATDDLLGAVLSLPCEPAQHGRLQVLRQAALEIVVLLFPDAIETSCEPVAARLRSLGMNGASARQLAKEAKAVQLEIRRAASPPPPKVLDLLPDAPVGPDCVVPSPWVLSERGVSLPSDDNGGAGAASSPCVIPAPVVIVDKATDVHTSHSLTTLAWRRNGAWQRRTVERRQVMDCGRILELAAYDAPVNSLTARSLVSYLTGFEHANVASLPNRRVSGRLGWHKDGDQDVFLLGRAVVTAEGVIPSEDPRATLAFLGPDEGEGQLVAGIRPCGTLEAWLDAVRPLSAYPRVLFALYAALVPPLLPILGSGSFVVDLSGETTSGKTTALRVAASVWGDPDETRPGSFLHTWDATPVWRERAPAVMGNLPLLLDDTQRNRREIDVQQTIYDMAQGRGRGRGTPKGLAPLGTWKTVLLSTGEQPATSFTRAGGAQARVLSIWGSPLGGKSSEAGELARQLTRELREHFGHAGPAVVAHLARHHGQWPEWHRRGLELTREYQARAGSNAIAGRLAEPLAVIRVAAEVCHEALTMPWLCPDPVGPLWEELTAESGAVDQPDGALRAVLTWAAANPKSLFVPGPHLAVNEQPVGGWAGVNARSANNQAWDASLTDGQDEGYLGLRPDRLKEILTQAGHSPEAVVRAWKGRGYLRCSSDSLADRKQLKVKLEGQSCWVVAIRESVIRRLSGA